MLSKWKTCTYFLDIPSDTFISHTFHIFNGVSLHLHFCKAVEICPSAIGSIVLLTVSKDEESTGSLGNMSQHLTSKIQNLFLMFKWNFLYFALQSLILLAEHH